MLQRDGASCDRTRNVRFAFELKYQRHEISVVDERVYVRTASRKGTVYSETLQTTCALTSSKLSARSEEELSGWIIHPTIITRLMETRCLHRNNGRELPRIGCLNRYVYLINISQFCLI